MPLFIAQHPDAAAAAAPATDPGLGAHEYFGNGDKQHPTCCGVGLMDPGKSATFKYPGYEFSIILEGSGEIVDVSKGETHAIKTGDVIHVEAGTTVTWKAVMKMKMFYVAAKELGDFDVRKM